MWRSPLMQQFGQMSFWRLTSCRAEKTPSSCFTPTRPQSTQVKHYWVKNVITLHRTIRTPSPSERHKKNIKKNVTCSFRPPLLCGGWEGERGWSGGKPASCTHARTHAPGKKNETFLGK